MNQYTQRFLDQNLETKFFNEQKQELLGFYKWICITGILAIYIVFVMEFFIPIGIGIVNYALPPLSLSLYGTYHFIKRHQNFLNHILLVINVSCGLIIDIRLLITDSRSDLFLLGQIVAFGQYSLLLGTNVLSNLIFLFLNQIIIALILIVKQQTFDSLSLVCFLSLFLILKSTWSNHKLRRQFFFLKYSQNSIEQTLNHAFGIGSTYCYLDDRTRQIHYQDQNNQMDNTFFNQQQFTSFIRSYQVQDVSTFSSKASLSLLSKIQTPQKKLTLELLIIKELENLIRDVNLQNQPYYTIYSGIHKKGYKVCLIPNLHFGKKMILLFLQEDNQIQKMIKLQNKVRKLNSSLKEFLQTTYQIRNNLGYLKFIQRADPQLKSYLQHPSMVEFEVLRKLYNIILLNKYCFNFGKNVRFNIEQFTNQLEEIYNYRLQKRLIDLKQDINQSINLRSNYLLLMQLLMNILEDILKENTKTITITYTNLRNIDIPCIKISIFSYQCIKESLDNGVNQNCTKNDKMIQEINKIILQKIGWNCDIIDSRHMLGRQITCTILQDLNIINPCELKK